MSRDSGARVIVSEDESHQGVPTDWSKMHLGEVTTNYDSMRVPVREADRQPGPYPYYGASGVVDHIDSFLFDGEFLLIAEDGENLRTRKTPVAFLATGQFWVNNHAHVVQANDASSTKFLHYALSNTDFRGFLTGSTMPKLTKENLNRIPILLPPGNVQESIVETLGTLDDKIELNRRMNQTLEEMARTLFTSWFVTFDPVRAKAAGRQPEGMDAATAALFPSAFHETGRGELPGGWEARPIGDVVRVVGGSTPSTSKPEYWKGEIPFCTPRDLSSLSTPILVETDRRITELGLATISSGSLPVGTVLMSSRAPIGYLALSTSEVAVNQGMIAMICNDRLPNHFVLLWAQQNMDTIIGNANGTTFLEISKRNFRPILVVVPPVEVLRRFSQIIKPSFERIEANERESQRLAAMRDTLLPRLLSGELLTVDAEDLSLGKVS